MIQQVMKSHYLNDYCRNLKQSDPFAHVEHYCGFSPRYGKGETVLINDKDGDDKNKISQKERSKMLCRWAFTDKQALINSSPG